MRTRWASLIVVGALSLAPARAWATHPDHEGERGLEAQLTLGGGTFSEHDDRVFLSPMQLQLNRERYDVFRGGPGFRALVGWRFNPYVAVHFGFGYTGLSSAESYAPSERSAGAQDGFSNWSVSLHARFYWLSLINGARTNPRVFFRGWGDVRRMESWVSLGVELLNKITRERTYANPDTVLRWTAEYTGVPIGMGFDYRFTPSLSAGVSLSLTPLMGQSMTYYARQRTVTASTDRVTETTTQYDASERSNFQWFLGIGARYTWTMF